VRVQCAVERGVIRMGRAIGERALEEMNCEGRLCRSESLYEARVAS